jgi:hypothetical protein
MIERHYGKYTLICDVCCKEVDEEFDDFQDAVDYKKFADWRSKNINGEWVDVCLDCQDNL